MATYKKKASKSTDKNQETIQDKSTTAEVFNTLDETASRSEKWIENPCPPQEHDSWNRR